MAIGTNKEYRMAVALLQFKNIYAELVAAAKDLPDLDLSELYPFYLLDFEQISENVLAWCNIHASKLLQTLPDRVDNPACLSCPYLRSGLAINGLCKGANKTGCGIYPMSLFTRESVIPALAARGKDMKELSSMDDTAIHLLYLQECENANKQK